MPLGKVCKTLGGLRAIFLLDFFIYLTKHMYKSLVAVSEEAAGILTFKLLPVIKMKLNLK